MFKRIQTRLMLIYSALFILVQGTTYFALYQITAPSIEEQIERQLDYSRTLIEQAMKDQMQELADGTKLLAADFGFRSAVATGDQATIFSALENLTDRIGSDHSMLISLDNEIIADTSDPEPLRTQMFDYDDLIEIADEEDQATTIMNMHGQLTEFVIVPVLAPEPIAWIGVSTYIDDTKAETLNALLPEGFNLSFFSLNAQDENWRLASSTLQTEIRTLLSATLKVDDISTSQARLLTVGDDNLMILTTEFPTIEHQEKIIGFLQYSMDVAARPYRSLALGLSAMVAIGLLVLIMGSAIIARGVTRPLRLLAEAAQRIQVGDYRPVQQFKQHREVDQLASSFNHMIKGIVNREQQIRHQSEHDIETGLANRSYCENYIENLMSKNSEDGITAMVISIKRFNTIRNTLGYAVGEELIKNIVSSLLLVAHDAEMIARLSTSSFVIVHPYDIPSRSLILAKQILEKINAPTHLEDVVIDVSLDIGIASYPTDAPTVETLLRRANIANVQANDELEHIARYNAEKDSHYADKLSMMGELRHGIDAGHVVFHYQPKIDLKSGKVSHVEALVRWFHPEKGFISPDEFIPMAEQTGQIQYLTHWGLDAAIKQCGEWRSKNIDINMAFNLSAYDLKNKELPKVIEKLLEIYDVKPEWMVLEVTESAVMQDPDLALTVLADLSDMGLILSIDDYGTGYSSLSYLKKLPVQEIKIDKSFVLNLASNKEDEILVRSTIDLGHNLGLKVTAEGVEDEQSYKMLQALDCDLAQGFYFSKAVPVTELLDFIANSPYSLAETESNAPPHKEEINS